MLMLEVPGLSPARICVNPPSLFLHVYPFSHISILSSNEDIGTIKQLASVT